MRFLIALKIFILFCVGCTGAGEQQTFELDEDFYQVQNLSSFDHIGSYSLNSFVLAVSRSSLFRENLSREESRLLSFSSLVFSDHIEYSVADALDLRHNRVKGFNIEYMTPDPYKASRKIRASGLTLIPSTQKALPILVYLHPTLLHKNEAPSLIPISLLSMDPIKDQRLMMVFLALQGYIVFAPDYIGYGSSEGMVHPYLYKKAITQTTAYSLRALEQMLDEDRIPFKREIFIMGYSQGGHGAMAFAEALQNSSINFDIQALAAGGGPYDMLYTVRESLEKKNTWKLLLGLLLLSYSYIYDWDLSDLLTKTEYEDIIHEIHKHDSLSKAVKNLPKRIKSLFRSDFVRDILKKGVLSDYQRDLEENSVYDWRPNFPVLLFHAKKDDIVPYRNMDIAYRTLRRGGSRISRKDCDFKKVQDIVNVIKRIKVKDIEPDHINCNFIFFLEAADYFADR